MSSRKVKQRHGTVNMTAQDIGLVDGESRHCNQITADVNAKVSRYTATTLEVALAEAKIEDILRGRVDVLELLLKQGEGVNARHGNEPTPLEFASCIGQVDITQLLLNGGANVNSNNVHGNTPLHLAGITRHQNKYHVALSYLSSSLGTPKLCSFCSDKAQVRNAEGTPS